MSAHPPPSQLAPVTDPNGRSEPLTQKRGGPNATNHCTRVLLSLHLMASRIVSWSGDEHIVSPNLSKTPSIISVNSIVSDKPEASPGDQDAPGMAESQPTHTACQGIEPNEIRISTSTTIYPGTEAADHDGSFMRHNKYFFKDGNITFLVREMFNHESYMRADSLVRLCIGR